MTDLTAQTKLARMWRDYRGTLAFVLMVLTVRSTWASLALVPTGSMNPTILEGDYLWVDKHSYGWRVPFTTVRLTPGEDPQRGEIVVFDSPKDGKSLVKRLIGLPGDTVEMRDEWLYINGRPLDYTRTEDHREILEKTWCEGPLFYSERLGDVEHTVMFLPDRSAPRTFNEVRIPEGQYLMLGDNRDNSGDSRYFGFVSRRNIVGRATRVVASFNPDRYYAPRADRFLAALD